MSTLKRHFAHTWMHTHSWKSDSEFDCEGERQKTTQRRLSNYISLTCMVVWLYVMLVNLLLMVPIGCTTNPPPIFYNCFACSGRGIVIPLLLKPRKENEKKEMPALS